MYETERSNIVAVMLAKDMAFVDPDDCTPIRTLCQFYQNPWSFVFEDVTLDIMLKEFKGGETWFIATEVHAVHCHVSKRTCLQKRPGAWTCQCRNSGFELFVIGALLPDKREAWHVLRQV